MSVRFTRECTLLGDGGVPDAGDSLVLTKRLRSHLPVCSLDTVGVYDFHGQFNDAFTAHPKTCPVTGELIFIRYSFQEKVANSYDGCLRGMTTAGVCD
jgi:Retinal pigment epithelial membrane protein